MLGELLESYLGLVKEKLTSDKIKCGDFLVIRKQEHQKISPEVFWDPFTHWHCSSVFTNRVANNNCYTLDNSIHCLGK
jgi:hypothetical protein